MESSSEIVVALRLRNVAFEKIREDFWWLKTVVFVVLTECGGGIL